jgi:hypothetical protein
MRLAISSLVGSRLFLHKLAAGAHQFVDRFDHVHRNTYGAWSAMARVMAWRIHHVAYVENL